MNALSDKSLAHFLARLGLGINILIHGLVRLPHLSQFAGGLEKQFAGSVIPGPLAYGSGFGIVFGETIVGAMLVLGLFMRPALVAGSLLMIFFDHGHLPSTKLGNSGPADGLSLPLFGVAGDAIPRRHFLRPPSSSQPTLTFKS